MPCYADDLTVVVESKNPDKNKDKLIEKLDNISNFLQNNGLCVNKDKTKCQNYMVKQKYAKVVCCDPLVMTVESGENEVKDIINQEQVRILGLNLQRDYSWRAHLETGGRPLLQSLRSRIGALKHLGNVIPMNGRRQLVNGLIISKLIYMIQVWGGTHEVHLTKIQRVVNSAARYVLNTGKRWGSRRLMEACKWMGIRELEEYHSLLTLWKILNHEVPETLFDKFQWVEDRKLTTNPPRLQTTDQYWRWRSIKYWNELPDPLRYTTRISQFKTELKKLLLHI